MTIIHKLSIDLAQRECPARIDAVQDDCGRSLALLLHTNGIPWPIPANVSATIRYRKSDGIGGEYDTLPDGTCAWSAADNVLTIALAPQVLTAAGETVLSVLLSDGSRHISTFDILLQVQPGIHSRITKSDTYVNVSTVTDWSPDDIGTMIMGGKIKSIVLLGDSITDGTGGSDYNGSSTAEASTNTDGYCWANVFKKFVENRYGIPVSNKGMFGTMMAEQVDAALQYITEDDFVIWLTGTNDRADAESYRANLRTNLGKIKEKCAGILLVSGIPATQADEKNQPVTMQKMDEIIMSEAAGFVPHFSMYQAINAYCEQQSIALADCFADHCHPNDLGYCIIFKLLCQNLGLPLDPYTDYESFGTWWKPIPEEEGDLASSYGIIMDSDCVNVTLDSNTVPMAMMQKYDAERRTTLFSGKHISSIELCITTAGTITIGVVDLNTCGQTKPVYLRSTQVNVSAGFISIPLGWEIGANETLALQSVNDTGALGAAQSSSPMCVWRASEYETGSLVTDYSVHGVVRIKCAATGGNIATFGKLLLDGADDHPGSGNAMSGLPGTAPAILMTDYNSATRTTAVSGKYITGLAMRVKYRGVITIGKVDLNTIGQAPVFTAYQSFRVTRSGTTLIFRLNMAVGAHETLAFQSSDDTGSLEYFSASGDLSIWKATAFAAGAKDVDLCLPGKIYCK